MFPVGNQLYPHKQMAYALCQEAYKFAKLPLSQVPVEDRHSPVPTSSALRHGTSDGTATEIQQRQRCATYTPQEPLIDVKPDGTWHLES